MHEAILANPIHYIKENRRVFKRKTGSANTER